MIYTGHHIYKLFTLLCVLLTLSFGWQLYNAWDWGALLFMGVGAWTAFRCAKLMTSRVALLDDRVQLSTVGRRTHVVEYRQLTDVYEEGRGLKSILLVYHPHMETTLLDLDKEESLSLPPVNKHEELLAALQAKVVR
jgi:hypothetical protein